MKMTWERFTSLIVLLQAFRYAVSLSLRSTSSNEGPPSSLRKLQACSDNGSNMKVRIDYGDDPEPLIQYAIYNKNGTLHEGLTEGTGLELSTDEDKFFESDHCLDVSSCYTLAIWQMARRGGRRGYELATRIDHYIVEVEFHGKKIVDGKATHMQYFKIGNCSSHVCDEGEAMLHIQMNGIKGKPMPGNKGPCTFDYAVYNGSGTLIETQQEGYAFTANGPHYFETSLCLIPSDCYTVWLPKFAFYQVDYNNKTVIEGGKTLRDTSVLKVGEADCPVCNSKPLLVDSSSYQRAHDIMSVITTISGMEAFLDTDSPHYQAACWMIYDDPYQVTSASKSLIQRYILALLFFSTDGWHWSKLTSFLSPISECDWNNNAKLGVKCNENGNVVHIILNNKNLNGYLISELTKLMDLEYLELNYNHLQGTIPNEFGQMKQMKSLELGTNSLTGTIPQGLLEIKNLERLGLAENMLTGILPSSTVSLPNLESIFLANNILHGTLPQDLYNATSLKYLDLKSNLFSGTIPENIGKTSLMEFHFSDNNVHGTIPTQLSNLPHAYKIQLSNNSLSGTIPPELGYLSFLNFLDVSYNSIYGELPSSFINLFSLENLYIQNNYLSGNVSGDFCMHFMNATTDYTFEADCADEELEALVNCSCCTNCYSHFSFLEHFGDCNGVELKIQIHEVSNEMGESWSVKDSSGRVILEEGPYLTNSPSKTTYTSCVATTGCYSMYATGNLEIEIFGNSASIHYSHMSYQDTKREVNFGYSSASNSLLVNKCDDITVYGEVAPQNTTRRDIFSSFERISGLHRLTSSQTPQYKSAEWLINANDNFADLTDHRIIQRYVLGIFYYSTGGEFWVNKKSWMDTNHECIWYGITCYDNKTVIGINLPQNNLNGSLPLEIGELSSLKNLSLPNNLLNGSIPVEIANLYKIHTIDLEKNTLSGNIPSMLQTLKELKVLKLGNNHISGAFPEEIGYLDKLTFLDFSNNTLTGSLPNGFYNLLKLERLDVSENFLYGSIDEKFESLSYLSHLDLSLNAFTGTVLNSISDFEKLQMLNIAQNKFKGSLPSGIGNLVELRTLLLQDNEFTGSVPTEIGNLEKIVNISLSDNLFRGSIPTELENLQNLKFLLLHRNQLAGDSTLFQKNQLNKFITDCGSILDSPAAVTCPYCTECCNSEGNCLTVSKTWPKTLKTGMFETMNGTAALHAIIMEIVIFVAFAIVALVVMAILKVSGFHKTLPQFRSPVRNTFARESVYRFILTENIMGWLIALITMLLQILIFHVFLNASDFTSGSNEWEYSVDCPKNSLDCEDTRTTNAFGWFMLVFIIGAFLLKDIVNAIMLLYESTAELDIRGLLASLVLMFITALTVKTSIVINYATGLTNAQILKDAAVLLFLSDMDEALYSAIKVISSDWIHELESQCNRMNDTSTSNSGVIAPEMDTPHSSAHQTDYGQLEAQVQNTIAENFRLRDNKYTDMELEMKKLRSQIRDLMKHSVMKKKTESEDLKCIANITNSQYEYNTELQHDHAQEDCTAVVGIRRTTSASSLGLTRSDVAGKRRWSASLG